MKDTYTIWFDAGKMMAFKMPDLCEKDKYPSKFPDCECNDKLLSARAASLPVADQSKEEIEDIILMDRSVQKIEQTKSYQIEAEFREREICGETNRECGDSCDDCNEFPYKVLVFNRTIKTETMKTQLTWEECLDQVAKIHYCGNWDGLIEAMRPDALIIYTKEAADLYRNQPFSLDKEELRNEFDNFYYQVSGCSTAYSHEISDWFFSKLSAKQREVDELKHAKEQMVEKVKEMIAFIRDFQTDDGGFVEFTYNEFEILSKLGLTEIKTKI